MSCLIDAAIERSVKEGRRIEVIRRFIRLKYRIKMDRDSIVKRIQILKKSPVVGIS